MEQHHRFLCIKPPSSAGGNVEIRYNYKLTDISGLSNLEVIGGAVGGKAVISPVSRQEPLDERRIDLQCRLECPRLMNHVGCHMVPKSNHLLLVGIEMVPR